jgi:excisionase family DNA binding protein
MDFHQRRSFVDEASNPDEGDSCQVYRLLVRSVEGSEAVSCPAVSLMELPTGAETEESSCNGRPLITMDEEVNHREGHAEAKVPQRLVGINDITHYVGLSKHTVYAMVSKRRIPFVKVGRLTRFDLRSVDSWIRQHSMHPRNGA